MTARRIGARGLLRVATAVLTTAAATLTVAVTPAPADALAGGCASIIHRGRFQGTEEQVVGVTKAARWGFGAEIDASLTADTAPTLVGTHDARMTRISGGASDALVSDLTLAEIRDLPYVYGTRVESTWSLIKAARDSKSNVMVTMNSYFADRDRWDNGGFQKLWQLTTHLKMEKHVYFGGYGAELAFHKAFPEALTFHRTLGKDAAIANAMRVRGADLVALDPKHFTKQRVRRLQAAGITVATRQLAGWAQWRKAHDVGIRVFQTNQGGQVNAWCKRLRH